MLMINLDYEKHPAFAQNSEEELLLDPTLTDRFNSAYSTMLRAGRFLGAEASGALGQRLMDDLQAIAVHLFEQAPDETSAAFLEDTFGVAREILTRDIEYYFRTPDPNVMEGDWSLEDKQRFIGLSEDGYFTGKLRDTTLARIEELVAPLVSEFRRRAAKGQTMREDLSVNNGQVVWDVISALNEDFDALGINRAVSQYCSRPMKATGLAIELSPANADWWRNKIPDLKQDPGTVYYHIDESPQNPKSIVYLTEVRNENGPTTVAPGFIQVSGVTHCQNLIGRAICNVGRNSEGPLAGRYQHIYHQVFGCPVFRADFMRLPAELRWNSHFGWDVIPGSQYEGELLRREKQVTGPAGSFVVFDGYGLAHRGGMVLAGERIALQVIFDQPPKPLSWGVRVSKVLRRLMKRLFGRRE